MPYDPIKHERHAIQSGDFRFSIFRVITDDSLNQMSRRGYFNRLLPELRVGDPIWCVSHKPDGSAACQWFGVVRIKDGEVEVAAAGAPARPALSGYLRIKVDREARDGEDRP